MRRVLEGALLLVLCSCGQRGDLPERHARATAETLVAVNGPAIRDFHRMKWNRLERVSPVEAHGLAVLVYRYRMPDGQIGEEQVPGKFVYRKQPGKGWVLGHVDFPNPSSLYHRLDREVMVEVTSARVSAAAVRGQLGPAADHEGEAGTHGPEPRAAADTSETAAAALPAESARRAAEDYLMAIERGRETWSARGFGPMRAAGDRQLELPATLLVQGPEGEREYQGAFLFTYRPDSRRWILRRLSFHADGADPIEEDVGSAVLLDAP